MKQAEPLLMGRGLSVSYGGVQAVRQANIEIGLRQIVGLIGPNGAGKTSLINGCSGFAPLRGELTFDGLDISRLNPHRRARLGLARTWQSVALFEDLTVAENLNVVASHVSAPFYSLFSDLMRPRRAYSAAAPRALELLGIRELEDRLPSELSHGQQVLVGVARALAASPKLVLMDEPAAGLSDTERAALADNLKRIASDGTAILLVDHDMELVFNVCSDVYVLDFGVLIAHGSPEETRTNSRVIAAYLGRAEQEAKGPQIGALTESQTRIGPLPADPQTETRSLSEGPRAKAQRRS